MYDEKKTVRNWKAISDEDIKKSFVDNLMADVSSHQGAAEQHDDITILTFKVL